MDNKRGKRVAVVHEKNMTDLLGTALKLTYPADKPADLIELTLDSLNYDDISNGWARLNVDGIRFPTIISLRHQDTIPIERRNGEGFKSYPGSDPKDWKRRDILREVCESKWPKYIEIEHDKRVNIFCIPSTIVRYVNLDYTPKYDALRVIFDRIKKHGADVVKLETRIQEPGDVDILRKLRRDHAKDTPLVTIGIGELGKELWDDSFNDGSPFIYGHTHHPVYSLFRVRPKYDNMQSISEVNKRLAQLKRN